MLLRQIYLLGFLCPLNIKSGVTGIILSTCNRLVTVRTSLHSLFHLDSFASTAWPKSPLALYQRQRCGSEWRCRISSMLSKRINYEQSILTLHPRVLRGLLLLGEIFPLLSPKPLQRGSFWLPQQPAGPAEGTQQASPEQPQQPWPTQPTTLPSTSGGKNLIMKVRTLRKPANKPALWDKQLFDSKTTQLWTSLLGCLRYTFLDM